MLAWADHRTLIACHCMLAIVFATVLLGMRRAHSSMRGVTSMALGFFLAVPGTALVSSRGAVSSVPAAFAANLLIFLCFLFLHRGVLRFCQTQFPPPRALRTRSRIVRWFLRTGFHPVLWTAALLSTCAIAYFSQIDNRVAPRVFTVILTLVVSRIVMALTLLRYSGGRPHMILFATSYLALAALNLAIAVSTLRRGPPSDLMDPDTLGSLVLLAGFVFICINGIFFVTMIGDAITRKIELQANLDFLTGTINRGGIEKALTMEIARTRRSRRPFSLLLIDLDRFKQINDLHGHAAGDHALRTAARAIGSVLRIYDKFGRFGGDEFLVLLPETSGEDAIVTANRIRTALATVLNSGISDLPDFTLSIGITHCISSEEPIDILARADSALYHAKHSGRDCVRLHLPSSTLHIVPAALPRASA